MISCLLLTPYAYIHFIIVATSTHECIETLYLLSQCFSFILNGQGKMKVLSLIFLTTVILCTLSHSLCAPVFQLGKEWHAWKAGNGKVYESDMDELERHLIWLSNMKYIEGHNANQGMFGYALSMNQYGDIVSIAALHTCI